MHAVFKLCLPCLVRERVCVCKSGNGGVKGEGGWREWTLCELHFGWSVMRVLSICLLGMC